MFNAEARLETDFVKCMYTQWDRITFHLSIVVSPAGINISLHSKACTPRDGRVRGGTESTKFLISQPKIDTIKFFAVNQPWTRCYLLLSPHSFIGHLPSLKIPQSTRVKGKGFQVQPMRISTLYGRGAIITIFTALTLFTYLQDGVCYNARASGLCWG